MLCVRSHGKDKFFIPGGKFELGESDQQALKREIKEELSIDLDESSIEFATVVKDVAYGLENTQVEMHCYRAEYSGDLTPCAEIAELDWVTLDDLDKCAPAAQQAVTFALTGSNE